jgi:phage host-nuclease inhibitor protein Gam
MARKRVENSIKSWQEADEALLQIGRLDREIEAHEAAAQKYIESIKEDLIQRVKPRQEIKAALEMQLQAFCEARREEMKGKSRKLNFGTVSFRQSTRIVIRGVQACIAALKSLNLHDFIRVKESPDKDKMKDLDDAVLAKVGAKRQPEDVFGYEVNRERVKEAA